ncbi:glycosyltransferase family 61 protein [Paracoccus beibuensis]|uniref:glycosyltransferase family 61 protein n=1 Tax=Paracoccus beibuensis TaxID=547602 RepID=UPI00223F2B20|nr:glycosyltransferase family 61 protein [Paracoccus beibuensis]
MSDQALTAEIPVQGCSLKPSRLITARSFLTDRAVADCEEITLPGRQVPGGTVPYGRVDRMAAPASRKGWRALLRRRPGPVPLQGDLGMDCRFVSPENWSHFLNLHAPLAFELMRRLDLPPGGMTLILPAGTPGFILKAADYLGLRTQCADGAVTGPGAAFGFSRNITIPDRRRWLKAAGVIDQLFDGPRPDLPRHLFLSRRGARSISNQAEIESVLAPRGFATVYPEDLSPADQFQLFNTAETIVAIHGAGLAPLLYRHPDAPLRHLVEILPCGHMTDFYRLMAQQVGCRWTGVRGRLKPEYVRPAYDLSAPIYRQHSLDSFEVDPVSLERALEG